MNDAEASKLADLTADLMMVIGRMKGSANHNDAGGIHPGTQYAVLDTIVRHGRQTVPEIAVWRGVKRQSVQTVVNKLVEAGLLGLRENPDHKSSKLLHLEPAGKRQYELAREQMRSRYQDNEYTLQEGDLEAAARVMAVIASTWGLEVGSDTD